MTLDEPGIRHQRRSLCRCLGETWTAPTPRPQRGQPHVDGPLGGPSQYHGLWPWLIINFGQMTECEARRWPDLFSIIEQRVKPARLAQNREARARYWWRFAETAPRLYQTIDGMKRVVVRSLTSTNFPTFTFLPGNMVYDQTLIVFAFESHAALAALCSRCHESWAVFFGGTMKDDPRYNVDDCFKTYPFPLNFESDRSLEDVGNTYYGFPPP